MSTQKPSAIAGEIVDLLTPFTSEERRRIVAASLTLLGEEQARPASRGQASSLDDEEADGESQLLKGKAGTWQKQNGVSSAQLEQAFHTSGEQTDVIVGDMPGKNKKEQTLNAYVLTGVAALLSTGEPTFSDKDARALCTSAGCYDAGNHAKTLSDKGNLFTGTKEKGWTLTAPGLKHGAAMIKSLATGAE